MATNDFQVFAIKEMPVVDNPHLNVGDVCYVYKPYLSYQYVIITTTGNHHYTFYTDIGTKESCHQKSLLASYLNLIASNMQSIEEAQSLYPEHFV